MVSAITLADPSKTAGLIGFGKLTFSKADLEAQVEVFAENDFSPQLAKLARMVQFVALP